MRKYILSGFSAYMIFSTLLMIKNGGLTRAKELHQYMEKTGTMIPMKDIFMYIIDKDMKFPTSSEPTISRMRDDALTQSIEKHNAMVHRAQQMHDAGYLNSEIAEAMGLNESTVRNMITASSRFFRVVLREDHHQTVELALRTLSPGDRESEIEVDDALHAFLDTTEEIEAQHKGPQA